MIINHNMASLNTYRQLSANNTNTGKSLEKLSSGLRINRAGDDAAGLAISEKMRGQIRGLDQATRNSQDAASMLNTAEGNLNEVHSILQRMKELATQSANDTNVGVDRGEIQKEINQLTSEVNRVGNTTEFNTQKLLNGGGVDPTTATKVSGNGLVVPANLTGGEGDPAAVAATSTMTFVAAATADDGKTFNLTVGDRHLTFTFSDTATSTSVNGDNITIDFNNADANTVVAAKVKSALDTIFSNDSKLSDNYTVSTGVGTVVVAAKAVSMDVNGKLTGPIDGGVAAFGDGSYTGATAANTSAAGVYATGAIDFSKATVADLKGTEIVIDGKRLAFYDSADGRYTGDANFAIDLNGARTGEKIVSTIVDAMSGTAAGAVAASVSGTDVYDASNSALANVYLTANGAKLQITSQAVGAAGNLIKAGNNAPVTVSQTYGNDRLANESVVSAKGLADGEQKVTLTMVGATVGNENTDGTVTAVAATINQDSTLQSGTYRLTNQGTLNHAQLQKLGADGTTWSTVTGYEDITVTGAAQTAGDLTFTGTLADFTAAAAGTNWTQFTITSKHAEATLTEAGSVNVSGQPLAGAAVTVNNGQQNVTLNSADGIGSAVVNVGAWDADNFDVGETISFSFDTKQATTDNTQVVGGTFKATFQIGASMGQSMSIEINDMRSQALQISGTAASGAASVTGAVFTAAQTVTNGTDNTNVEYALDVSDHTKATAAIKVLDNAINKVSAERSKIGAYTNRLEHTINNLGTSSENLTAAESRIRDVDMAKEMMSYQKNNILSQAATAMLAQANQQPQGVLQLLR